MSKETAFHPRLAALTDEWMDLFGYSAPTEVTDTQEEYRAVRETAGLMDFTMLRKVDIDGVAVAVVRIGDDVYAIGDTCSHADFSLSEGEVFCDEREIECWKHGSMFSLETGEPRCLPATKPVPVYTVRLEGDDVMVEVR